MSGYRVLVVEDDPLQRALIRDTLSVASESFEVVEASDGEQAIALLERIPFDAILMDKRMPAMTGDQVCRHIRGPMGLPLLPVIMVTGTNSSEELAISFDAGATDFISKPYSPTELLARLGAAVRAKRATDQLDNAESLLFSMARLVEAKDETTGDHCSRLAHFGSVFGRRLGLEQGEIEALRRGGILHDIGKLGIPDSILLKAGPLSDAEWHLMRQHTVIGAHLCDGLASMKDVIPIILHHHERLDGSGYPHGLAGSEIPLLPQVFQIVDIYDALALERPYKPALKLDQIISVFKSEAARGWRRHDLVEIFIDMLRRDFDALRLPVKRQSSRDERIFAAISDTGVIAWDRSSALEAA